jgi:hypothetical protein
MTNVCFSNKRRHLFVYQINDDLCFSGLLCQDDEALSHETKLCEDKSAGELFRLKAGEDSCRDVIQCTAAVSTVFSSENWRGERAALLTVLKLEPWRK